MISFDDIPDLLARFNYSKQTILGFCYFLGFSAPAGKKGEITEDVHARLARLPSAQIAIIVFDVIIAIMSFIFGFILGGVWMLV